MPDRGLIRFGSADRGYAGEREVCRVTAGEGTSLPVR